ncbi:MAG: DUF4249 domain-containing protein [Chitinophagaceae bacterium]|nr:DUF4249 domain-containing protein [Chitinophagaceae bacterium]
MLLNSCEKTINITPDQQTPKLVVEAQIENGQPPAVALSNSLNYFTELDPATLSASYVHNARITINDGFRDHTLQEYSLLVNGTRLYYYSTNQLSPATSMYGIEGYTYRMTIEVNGQSYTSTTTIPSLTKRIDSLWWKTAPFQPDSSKVVLMARVTDPPGLGNYIRYFTRVGQGDYDPGYNSVYDDQIIDGKTYDVQIDQGVSKNSKQRRDDYAYFRRGDTVTVKHCNIDKASFDFWRTWEFSYQSLGNPFSSPGKVKGNISNGALGSFCGYAAMYKTLLIPK